MSGSCEKVTETETEKKLDRVNAKGAFEKHVYLCRLRLTSCSKVSLLERVPERRRVRFPLGSPRRNMRNAHLCSSLTFPLVKCSLLIVLPHSEPLRKRHCAALILCRYLNRRPNTRYNFRAPRQSYGAPLRFPWSPTSSPSQRGTVLHMSLCFPQVQIENPYLICSASAFPEF